ncbi:IS1595 family transposase [Kaistia algarum]|uniref:IS1595 family transposase n=1 Tax=Kaistia algarum TaxID=2083279 RepID=UPI000CE8C829|nr:IS1595 family transposase [Kaistia algarum]MCX5512166.1 IS1595 family transposase [Kaistia algarum]PPE80267.1 IS1595 family transposase [Kaistia algarum]
MFDITAAIYTDADKAREHLEALHWPNGPICPHCGNVDPTRITKLQGKSTRPGVYKCKECREPFTVTVGTVFERSKIALNKWVLASHLMAASKKGMSAHQIHRMLGVTYKTAWFMCHRIREAMAEDVKSAGPMGGSGKIVEADETYFGKTDIQPTETTSGRPFIKKGKTGPSGKRAVVGLVERGGKVRMFHVEKADVATVRDILVRNVDRRSELHTDESRLYVTAGKEFGTHETTKHSAGEYVRYEGERVIHSNSIEGAFGLFKRGMKGIYHHCGEAHLHRYLAEFDFRYNRRTALKFTDAERAEELLLGARGKRLTYRRLDEARLA